ncbi:MAG: M48 family metallopeptidase [Sulfurimonas sp.]
MHDTKQYEIEIVYNPKLKHSYISITREQKVVLKTSYRSQKKIDEILIAKDRWISKKLLQIKQQKRLSDQVLHSLSYLESRVVHYSSMMELKYSQLKFRKMRRRWGSCSSEGVITLNKELLKLEKKELLDYVVVHELAHLQHMNHSKAFHALVERYLPNSAKLRQELKSIQIVSA